MTHDILLGEAHDRDVFDTTQRFERVRKTRAGAGRQIDLARVAGHDHARALAEPGEKHLHLHRRRVLRLVEDHEGARQSAPAHEGDRRHLDLAAGEPLGDLVRRQHVVERVEDRPQIGIDLVAQIARQKAEPLAGFDCRAGQDDPLDLPAHQQIDRGSDREIGLAGAGRPEPEHQFVLAHCLDIGGLSGRARPDAAFAGTKPGILAPQAEALVLGLGLRQAQRRLNRGEVDLVAPLQPVVEPRQGEPGDFGRRSRPGNRQPIAARHQRHPELPFDAIEMLVALAIEQGQQEIIVEFELAAPGCCLADRLRRRTTHAACTPSMVVSAIAPARLFGSAARTRTGTISPMQSGAASAWTLCK